MSVDIALIVFTMSSEVFVSRVGNVLVLYGKRNVL